MLVFGPYRACIAAVRPNRETMVYNFSSLAGSIPSLNYLLPSYTFYNEQERIQCEQMYYQYLLTDSNAFAQLISIIVPLYEGKDVFICTSGETMNQYIEWMNDLFIAFLHDRYGYLSAIINNSEDIYAFNDADFAFTVEGIQNLDTDRERYTQQMEIYRLQNGGKPYA